MNLFGIIVLVVSAVCSVGANLLIKRGVLSSGGLTFNVHRLLALAAQPSVAGGFILYFVGAALWFHALSNNALSVSYPLLVGITFTLLTLTSMAVLNEPVSVQKVIGLGMIVVGIVVVCRA